MVIATVFLSIIGMSAGLVLGSHHDPEAQGDGSTSYVPTEPTFAPVECPKEMHDTARRLNYDVTLTQVLKVRTLDTGMTVWICQDEGGRLFYQANKGGVAAKWIEGDTALFLADVVRGEDDYHAEAADGNTFSVNKQRLAITFKSGKTETHDVVPG